MPPADDGIDLDNREFAIAWQIIARTRRSVFLTGKAGTGKSTFLRYITANTSKNYVVLAPTGIAAVNVGGQTLHSFFRLPFKPLLPDDPEFERSRFKKRMKYPSTLIKLLKKLDLIIIDEISMVRADIIDFIDKTLRIYCNNMREPFGGKQLLLVGDIFQLEPVVTADMRQVLHRHYPNPFFFSAKVFADIKLIPIELRKVYRQNDSGFIAMLDRIRTGVLTPADSMAINSRVRLAGEKADTAGAGVRKRRKKMVMTLAARRDAVEHINDTRLKQIRKPMRTFTGEIIGDFPSSNLPAPLELNLKEGAQVVFVKNDFDKRWVNGTIGKVTDCLPDRIEVTLENGKSYVIEPERWGNVVFEYDEKSSRVIEKETGAFLQYPVKLAWALTIHKSQGLTFNNVVIDMAGGAFTAGQTYVAMSRCTSLEGIELMAPISPRDVFVSNAIIAFSREFNNGQLIENALRQAKARECYAGSLEAWDAGDYAGAFDRFMEGRSYSDILGNRKVQRLIKAKLMALAARDREIERLESVIAGRDTMLRKLAAEYVDMGKYCMEADDNVPAMANFDKALSIAPDMPEALSAKGYLMVVSGDPVEGMDLMLRAVDLCPQSREMLLALAKAYDHVGDRSEARRLRARASKLKS